MDTQSYKQLYIITAQEHIKILKKNIDLLKNQLDNRDAVDQIHLHAHSFKSQNMIMGYEKMGTVCQHIEVLFRGIKEGARKTTHEEINKISEIIDSLNNSLKNIENNNSELDLTKKIAELERI